MKMNISFLCLLLLPLGAAADWNLRGLMQRIFNTQAADLNLRRLAGAGGMGGGGGGGMGGGGGGGGMGGTSQPVTLSPTNVGETRAPVVTPKPKKGKKTKAPVTLSPTNEGETRAPVVTKKPKKTKKPKVTLAPSSSPFTSSTPSQGEDVVDSEAPSV
jgi:hypothetical protein